MYAVPQLLLRSAKSAITGKRRAEVIPPGFLLVCPTKGPVFFGSHDVFVFSFQAAAFAQSRFGDL